MGPSRSRCLSIWQGMACSCLMTWYGIRLWLINGIKPQRFQDYFLCRHHRVRNSRYSRRRWNHRLANCRVSFPVLIPSVTHGAGRELFFSILSILGNGSLSVSRPGWLRFRREGWEVVVQGGTLATRIPVSHGVATGRPTSSVVQRSSCTCTLRS